LHRPSLRPQEWLPRHTVNGPQSSVDRYPVCETLVGSGDSPYGMSLCSGESTGCNPEAPSPWDPCLRSTTMTVTAAPTQAATTTAVAPNHNLEESEGSARGGVRRESSLGHARRDRKNGGPARQTNDTLRNFLHPLHGSTPIWTFSANKPAVDAPVTLCPHQPRRRLSRRPRAETLREFCRTPRAGQ
jgi:hypothetical protein